jgi:hypothetical protein
MLSDPMYSSAGSETEKIEVRLSYRIVRLFSEGLSEKRTPLHRKCKAKNAGSLDSGMRPRSG